MHKYEKFGGWFILILILRLLNIGKYFLTMQGILGLAFNVALLIALFIRQPIMRMLNVSLYFTYILPSLLAVTALVNMLSQSQSAQFDFAYSLFTLSESVVWLIYFLRSERAKVYYRIKPASELND